MKFEEIKKWKGFIIAILIIIFLQIFSSHPDWVEKYYSNGLYLSLSHTQRILFGWLPFSIGDLLYSTALLLGIVGSIKIFRQYHFTLKAFGILVKKILQILLWTYIAFNFLWSLNYYRTGFRSQLKIKPVEYSTSELKNFSQILVKKLNTDRHQITPEQKKDSSYSSVLKNAIACYNKAATPFPFIAYRYKSIKSSMFNTMGNYLGFLGYYNPFTGEAHINTNTPSFILPFTACHEMGHQLGYASESEASFAAYLVSINSGNKTFEYSACFELFLFANQELFFADSGFAKQNFCALDTLVKQDIRQYRNYLYAYNNALEPFITALYGDYLKANNQPKGIQSYNEVLAWVLAYIKKYGAL